jgi:hemerythrin-like domain-containing protein
MSSISHLRVQHHELVRLARDIARLLEAERPGATQTSIRLKLVTLARKWRVHSAIEGRAVFDRLLQQSNPAIAIQAMEHQRKAHSLGDRISLAARQWMTDEPTNRFLAETKAVLELIPTRLELEENELYPLMESYERSGTWPVDATSTNDETRKTG